jgi:hypothetical protein
LGRDGACGLFVIPGDLEDALPSRLGDGGKQFGHGAVG